MKTSIAVADDILKLAKRQGKSLTPMQVTKIAYIAYGWHLATQGERLFDGRIEAWKYGPVVPEIYKATKSHGRDPIPHSLILEEELHFPQHEELLGAVVSAYGDFSGIQLSNLTHKEGTPWQQIYDPEVIGSQIPDALIKAHYEEQVQANK